MIAKLKVGDKVRLHDPSGSFVTVKARIGTVTRVEGRYVWVKRDGLKSGPGRWAALWWGPR